MLPPLEPVAEKSLRTLVANAKDTEIAAHAYLIATDFPGRQGPPAGRRLRAPDRSRHRDPEGDPPAAGRADPMGEPQKVVIQGPEDLTGVITAQAGYVRDKLLEESLWGHNLFALAVPIDLLGKDVIKNIT